ncbi:DUF4870 domain-containing protein [Acetonema longum]|uniref:DUF4870 domain-containing protein n=1 Tax=Acetonema longum TaxID=2374 RepID=UPI001EE64220|nr:DUF4870 domain-containing protein [Acetonema longum]
MTTEQKLLAIVAHLAYFFGGLGFVIAPLAILIWKREDPFIYHHAKQALVVQGVLLIASLAVGLLSMLLVGLLLVPILVLAGIALVVTSLFAAYNALNGELYRYPLIQSLVDRL